MVTADRVDSIPIEVMEQLVADRGLYVTFDNILRERDRLRTALSTYYLDRIDIAVPTPGAQERKWATMGTRAGTSLGEAVRLMMLFKSFPITIMNKVVGRNVYGQGAMTMKQWLLHDHRGKLNLAILMAMGTIAGYLSGAIRDALKGREPKPLILPDGTINVAALNDAAIRGGTLGILGDVLLSEYDANYKSFLSSAAGPVAGQLNRAAAIKSGMQRGEDVSGPAGKMLLDNSPFINLFYVRPVLDYLFIWSLEEALSPGILSRREAATEKKNAQDYFLRPSEVVR